MHRCRLPIKKIQTVITPEYIQRIDGKITKYKQQIVELEDEIRRISNSNAQEIIMQDNEEKQGSLVEDIQILSDIRAILG